MSGLEPHVQRLYDSPGRSIVAIVEMRHDTRLQPASGSDAKPTVTVKITGCEVANADQEGALREAQRALFLMRTAAGTFDQDTGQVDLAEDTMRRTGGLLTAIEVAKLRAGLLHWAAYGQSVVDTAHRMSATELTHEMDAIVTGLKAVLGSADNPIGDDDDE
jgi:hypothetical protein